MRWLYVAIIVVFLAAIVVFAAQNTQIVTVAFLQMRISVPLALAIFVVYVLGAATGGSLYALLRRSVHGSRGAAWAGSNR